MKFGSHVGKLTNATLQFLSVPPEKLGELRKIVRRASAEAMKHSDLPAAEFWKTDGIARRSMEQVIKLLELPEVLVAIEKDIKTDRPFEYITPERMPPVVVIHPDVIDAIKDPEQRAELFGRVVFEAPMAHLAAHHAGKLNWRKVEEFFGWAAERTGL
jgi:hypothetical protein